MLGKVNIEVLGIVENMSGLLLPNGSRVDVFGAGGGAALADSMGVPLLASIPLEPRIREGGDKGLPAAADPSSPAKPLFDELAAKLLVLLDQKLVAEPALKIVN
jgi:ATP-binding protein involved in chromosome partitioning